MWAPSRPTRVRRRWPDLFDARSDTKDDRETDDVQHRPMSEVETLLRVDAGKAPAGVVVFHARDPEADVRRLRKVLAVGAALVTIALAAAGATREPVAMLVL